MPLGCVMISNIIISKHATTGCILHLLLFSVFKIKTRNNTFGEDHRFKKCGDTQNDSDADLYILVLQFMFKPWDLNTPEVEVVYYGIALQ